MANTKISDFTSGSPAQSTDEFVIARSGANFKLTADNVRALFVGTANTFTATQTFTPAVNTSALVGSGYSLTGSASASFVDLSGTWNTSGTPTLIKANVTDSNSNPASLLMDLQVGGVSKFVINKNAVARFRNGPLGTILNLVSVSADESGVQYASSSMLLTNAVYNNSTGVLGWTSSGAFNTSPDTFLTRRAAANLRLGAADAAGSATVTITIATPGVVTWSSHGLSTGTPVIFSTTGALPTGITAGTTYYAIVVDGNTFRIATSFANALAGTAVNTSGSQSGTQTGTRGAIDQTLSVQSVVAGTTNFPGADFVISGSQGTGTGAGGSIVFQVAPAGSSGTAQNALATALAINSDRSVLANTLFISSTGDNAFFSANGGNNVAAFFKFFGIAAVNGNAIGISSGNGFPDVVLQRDAANTLALRNGANEQRFNLYQSYTDASNYSRLAIGEIDGGGRFYIKTENAGTGSARGINIRAASGQPVYLGAGSVDIYQFSASGFLFGADNTYDIGAVSASRPRNVYVAGSIAAGGAISVGSSNTVSWNAGGSYIFGNASTGSNTGTFRLVSSGGTPALNFGGDTSSFPALKRSSATLQARLADDSAFAPVQGKLTTDTAYTAGAPTATGYIIIYDSTGTAYRVPAVAN